MTKVELMYNPFITKTELLIDGNEIATTSDLYRYRNTPLEDWIDVLVPKLVDYCNDETFEISIKSIKRYIDEIKNNINKYAKSNNIHVTVYEVATMDIEERLSILSKIRETILGRNGLKEQASGLKLFIVSLEQNDETSTFLQSLIGVDYSSVSEEGVISLPSYDRRSSFAQISDNKTTFGNYLKNMEIYYFTNWFEVKTQQTYRDCLSAGTDYILLSILNSIPEENDSFFDSIIDQLGQKGKRNRSKYLFVSSNAVECMEYFRSEYGDNIDHFFDINEITELQESICNYIDNYFYINRLTREKESLLGLLQNQKEQVSDGTVEITQVKRSVAYKDYIEMLDRLNEHYQSMSLVLAKHPFKDEYTLKYIKELSSKIRMFLADSVIEDREKQGKNMESYSAKKLMEKLKSEGFNSYCVALAKELLISYAQNYLNDIFVIKATETATTLKGMVQKEYSSSSIIENKITELCDDCISGIKETTRLDVYKSPIEYFDWIFEKTEETELEVVAENMITFAEDGNYDYGYAVFKSIDTRLRVMKKPISFVFEGINELCDSGFLIVALNEKKAKVSSMIDLYKKNIIEKIEVYEKGLIDKEKIQEIEAFMVKLETLVTI